MAMSEYQESWKSAVRRAQADSMLATDQLTKAWEHGTAEDARFDLTAAESALKWALERVHEAMGGVK